MYRLLFTTFFLFCFKTLALAQVFYDSFSYPVSVQLTDFNWVEHSGNGFNPIKTVEGLRFSNQNISSSGIALSGSGQDIHRLFPSINEGSLYARILVNVQEASGIGDYFFHLGPNPIGTEFRAKVFVRNSDGKVQFGISKSSNSASWSSESFDFNTTYLLVLRYKFNNGSNQDDEVELSILSEQDVDFSEQYDISSTNNEQDASRIGAVAFRQGSSSNAPKLTIDELKLTNSWKEAISFSQEKFVKLNAPEKLFAFDKSCVSQPIFSMSIAAFGQNFPMQIWSLDSDRLSFSKDRLNWLNQLTFNSSSDQINDIFWVKYKGVISKPFEELKLIIDDFEANLLLERTLIFNQIQLREDCSLPISAFRELENETKALVRGLVTASNNEFGNFCYIQDQTGGLRVNADLPVEIGDSVILEGIKRISQDEPVLELDTCCNSSAFLRILGQKSPIAKEINLSELGQNLGMLVKVKQVEFKDKAFVLLPNSNEQIQDISANGIVRIWGSTELDGFTKPQSSSEITGIVGQFRDQFQIYPRIKSDIPDSQPYVFPNSIYTQDQTFDFAAWNVEWFGNPGNGPNDDALQTKNVAQSIAEMNPDAMVLTEVSSTFYFNELLAILPEYSGTCSNAVSGGVNDGNAQKVCLIYRKDNVELIAHRPLLTGVGSIPNYPESSDRFWASGRLPALFVCDVNLNGIKRRLHLIGIHARANRANGEDKDLIYNMRKKDVEVLKDSLGAHFSSASIIIAGDYNDDLDESVVSGYSESTYASFVNDKQNWTMVSKELSEKGYKSYIGFDNVIDHIGFSNELNDSYLNRSVSLAMPFINIEDYTNTTSDHLPVTARFLLNEAITSNELSQVDSILIYPNPSKGAVWIKSNLTYIDQAELFSATGQLLASTHGAIDKVERKISKQLYKSPNGTFLLKLIIGNKLKSYKIVNQH